MAPTALSEIDMFPKPPFPPRLLGCLIQPSWLEEAGPAGATTVGAGRGFLVKEKCFELRTRGRTPTRQAAIRIVRRRNFMACAGCRRPQLPVSVAARIFATLMKA